MGQLKQFLGNTLTGKWNDLIHPNWINRTIYFWGQKIC